MIDIVEELNAAQLWKEEEAQERLRLIAVGETGAWPWAKLDMVISPKSDDAWLLELEMERS